jgi:glycosyltransferase involved in cell wall biosynthesis
MESVLPTTPQRVAMLVHNEVFRDARVIKEAKTLWKAGYTVEIHGISSSDEGRQDVLPETDIRVFLSPRSHPRHRILILTALAIAALWFTFLGFSLARVSTSALSGLMTLFVINFTSLTALYVLRYRLRSWFRSIKNFVLRQINRFGALRTGIHNESFRAKAKTLDESVASRPPPDIVHIHDHVALIAARSLKDRYSVPLIWDAHEIYEDLAAADPAGGRLNAALIATNQDVVDGFVTINDSIGAFYEEHYKALGKPTVVMNATIIQPLPDYDGRLHEAANLPRSQRILLFQGGLAQKRGLRQLVKAAPLLNPDWSIVLMGWGNLEDELREIASANKPRQGPPAVVFLPGVPQHELQIWSAGASLGAIPYENTGLNHLYCTPNKLWEYPNALVPILATDLIEMGALIRENEVGFLMPREFDEHDIAKIVNAISDDDLQQARKNCARFIKKNNWETYAPRLLKLYEKTFAEYAPEVPRARAESKAMENAAS